MYYLLDHLLLSCSINVPRILHECEELALECFVPLELHLLRYADQSLVVDHDGDLNDRMDQLVNVLEPGVEHGQCAEDVGDNLHVEDCVLAIELNLDYDGRKTRKLLRVTFLYR